MDSLCAVDNIEIIWSPMEIIVFLVQRHMAPVAAEILDT